MSKRKLEIPKSYAPDVVELPNGIRLVFDLVPSVSSCAIGIWVKAGTRDEPKGMAGIAHLIEHTAFRRTKHRTTQRIARDFENIGAYTNAYTTKEETCYYVRTLTDHVHKVFPTLVDVVLNPLFRKADVAKEQSIIVEEIKAYEDEPEEYAFDLAEFQMFGRHPLGNQILGTASSVLNITSGQLRTFHRSAYNANSIVVTVSGNIDKNRFVELAASLLSKVRPSIAKHKRTLPPVRSASVVCMPSSTQQAHMVWHTRTRGQNSKSRSALALLNIILGDGLSSRIHMRLRDRNGLAYNASSQLQLFTDVGMLAVYAGADVRNEDKIANLISKELTMLATHGIKPVELRRAKEQIRAAKIMSLESLSSRMSLLGKGMLDSGRPEDPFDTINEVLAVEKDEVDALASTVCDPSLWSRLTLRPNQ